MQSISATNWKDRFPVYERMKNNALTADHTGTNERAW